MRRNMLGLALPSAIQSDVVVHATDAILRSASPRQVGLAFGTGSTCKGHNEPALRGRREPPGIGNRARTLPGSRQHTVNRRTSRERTIDSFAGAPYSWTTGSRPAA